MAKINIDDDLIKFGDIYSTELMDAVKENIEYLAGSIPIGQINPFFFYPGIPEPNESLWQECNGSIITEKKSPLYNPETPDNISGVVDENKVNRTPDLTDRYMKMPELLGSDGIKDGVNQLDLTHDHGHVIPTYYTTRTIDLNNIGRGHDISYQYHWHLIQEDLPNIINIEPPFFGIKFYIRIL